MNQPSYQEITKSMTDLKDNIDQVTDHANSLINVPELINAGVELRPDNARVIGVYGGYSPGALLAGGEVQTLVLYDKLTGESGVYTYTGVTAGPNLSIPGIDVVGGVVLFDGPLSEVPGISYGIQGSALNAEGVSKTPAGYTMVQTGVDLAIAAEFTFGYTWDLNSPSQVKVDWVLAEKTLNKVYADDKAALAEALADLAQAKFQPTTQEDFLDKYGAIIGLGASCFPAGTLITLADTPQNPSKLSATVISSSRIINPAISPRKSSISYSPIPLTHSSASPSPTAMT